MPNINKNIIMQAGAAVTNATHKAAGLSASTPEPGTIISAIQLVNGGRKIGPTALAHFTESVRNKLLSLLVDMEPIQDFNGYDHPWPAGGGKNLLPDVSRTASVYDVSMVVAGNSVTMTGLASGSGGRNITRTDTFSLSAGTYYLKRFNVSGTAPSVYVQNGTTILSTDPNGKFVLPADSTQMNIGFNVASGTNYNYTATFAVSKENITEWTPYENICPISGRTGLDVYAGPTDTIGDATTYTMDWTTPAGTVYAGSADIVTGDIKAAPYYASYNGETLTGPWVSSMDVYEPEGTPTTGAQVVDLGGTMTEYHITGQNVITLVGDNYIWSDSGDVTITE